MILLNMCKERLNEGAIVKLADVTAFARTAMELEPQFMQTLPRKVLDFLENNEGEMEDQVDDVQALRDLMETVGRDGSAAALSGERLVGQPRDDSAVSGDLRVNPVPQAWEATLGGATGYTSGSRLLTLPHAPVLLQVQYGAVPSSPFFH